MTERLSRDPAVRLRVFVDAGLIPRVPTAWQFFQGQLEMAPYVVMPDEGDRARYAGAPYSHPLVRTPIVLWEVGPDHLRVGHGLHNKPESVYRHLNFVQHESIPVFDLQLVQTVPGGLEALRAYTAAIDAGATPARARQRRRIGLILPRAEAYRARFLEPGGWIDRAARMDYPDTSAMPAFLRPEFTSLVGFANYCAQTFPAHPREMPLRTIPGHLTGLFARRFRAA